MDMQWMPRKDVISQLTDDLCSVFVACKKKSKYKKRWLLEAILAASGVGKTRLGIETIQAILQELKENPKKYKGNICSFTVLKESAILQSNTDFDELVATVEDAQWVFLDFSNGGKIPREWIEAATDNQLDDLVAGYLAIKILSPTSHYNDAYSAVHGKQARELLQIIANSVRIKSCSSNTNRCKKRTISKCFKFTLMNIRPTTLTRIWSF
jgi:hypothetical protein